MVEEIDAIPRFLNCVCRWHCWMARIRGPTLKWIWRTCMKSTKRPCGFVYLGVFVCVCTHHSQTHTRTYTCTLKTPTPTRARTRAPTPTRARTRAPTPTRARTRAPTPTRARARARARALINAHARLRTALWIRCGAGVLECTAENSRNSRRHAKSR